MTALPTIGILSAKFTAHILKTRVSDHAHIGKEKGIYIVILYAMQQAGYRLP